MLLLAYTEDRSTVYFKCCSEKQNLSKSALETGRVKYLPLG